MTTTSPPAPTRARGARLQLRAADLERSTSISPGDAARLLGVSVGTLRVWADRGQLVATTSPGGQRRYDRAEIEAMAIPAQEPDPEAERRAAMRAQRLRIADTMSEAALQSQVFRLADAYGWRSQHTYDSRRDRAGFPDLVLVRRGVLLVKELKTMKGRVAPAQQVWLDDFAECGADAGVWRPIDLLDGTVAKTLEGRP